MSTIATLFLDLAQHGREGHVIRDTYDAWRSQVAEETQRRRQAGRPQPDESASHKGPRLAAALIIQEYLAANSTKVKNTTAAARVRSACAAIASDGRKQRFEKLPHDTNVDAATANSRHGVYVLIRWESFINSLVQELVILSSPRGREKLRHATVIGRGAVLRGHWNMFGATLHMTAAGYRAGHRPEFVAMAFSLGDSLDHAIGGVLTGLTTDGRVPVTAQVLAIKIDEPRDGVLSLGDMADPYLIEQFCKLAPASGMDAAYVNMIKEMYDQVRTGEVRMSSWFEQRIVGPTDNFVARVHQESIRKLVHPKLFKFVTARRVTS
jgi:hypothetical protein